jgi:hypothetical protein
VPDPGDQADQHITSLSTLSIKAHQLFNKSSAREADLQTIRMKRTQTTPNPSRQTGDGSANLNVCPLTDESDNQDKPQKRKHNFEGSRDSKRIQYI